jgi:hypothetical protein
MLECRNWRSRLTALSASEGIQRTGPMLYTSCMPKTLHTLLACKLLLAAAVFILFALENVFSKIA